MLALSRPVRSELELTVVRAQAEQERASWGDSAYIVETRDAAMATLDWLLGRTDVAPATHEVLAPDDRSVPAQRLRAERLEQEGGDEDGSARRYGRVGRVLAWALMDPDVETPL